MGVLNVTPDSFSDGGHYADSPAAVDAALQMVADGATFVDVGGESTRPGAADVSVDEELARVIPVVEALADATEACISVDTSKPEVMAAVIAAGADMINDVYALRRDGALEAVAGLDCAICLMHMQGEPRTMQANPSYGDIAEEVGQFLDDRVRCCNDAGIDRSRIVIDPGFGFGKVDAHNLRLLADLGNLQSLQLPVLVGLSRKRTLGNITGRDVADRMPAGLAVAVLAFERGARIVRTHDVSATVDALKMAAAVNDAARAAT